MSVDPDLGTPDLSGWLSNLVAQLVFDDTAFLTVFSVLVTGYYIIAAALWLFSKGRKTFFSAP